MGAAGRIWHSTLSDGITADWQKLGENVGMGGTVDALHSAFVASPHHYENLVDPDFTYVGVGVVVVNGTIYVSETFMKLQSASATTPVASAPATAPKPPAPKPAPKPKPQPVAKVAAAPAPVPVPVPAPAPIAEPAPTPVPEAPVAVPAPPAPPREPSALLVSVLERLRTFD
jgi:hypothetical protein